MTLYTSGAVASTIGQIAGRAMALAALRRLTLLNRDTASSQPEIELSRDCTHLSGPCAHLELAMQASREDRDWASVGVVRRVRQELVVERQHDTCGNAIYPAFQPSGRSCFRPFPAPLQIPVSAAGTRPRRRPRGPDRTQDTSERAQPCECTGSPSWAWARMR